MAGQTVKGQPKEVKILSVTKTMKDGAHQTDNNGNYRHVVKFEGDDIGYGVTTKDVEASAWKVGSIVTVIPGSWTSDDGTTTLHFASLQRTNNPYKGGGYKPKGIKEYLAEGIFTAMQVAGHMTSVQPEIKAGDLSKNFKGIYSIIKSELTNLFPEDKQQ